MMKTIYKIYKVLLIVGAMGILYSCDDELEINPEDSLTEDSAFESEFAIRGVTNGLYGQAREVDALNGNRYAISGLQSDEMTFVGSFTSLADIFEYETQATNTNTQEFWDEGYEIINNANFLIAKVPDADIVDFTEEEKDDIIGQAKFMRAIMYFEMSRVYAQPFQLQNGNNLCVPITIIPFESGAPVEDFELSRSTLNQVHTLIIEDLEDAITLLQESTDNTIASKGAAQALLARLYLYREEWTAAATLANEVIISDLYEFSDDYSFYKTVSDESIFILANTATDGTFGGTSLHNFASPSPAGRGDLFYSDFLVSALESGIPDVTNTEGKDLRLIDPVIIGNDANGVEEVFQNKISSTGNDPLPIIRITEMYFIRAEANLRGNLTIGDTPLNDINRIRSRAGLIDLTAVTLDDILEERLKEFASEGHRRMDLLRNSRGLRQAGDPEFSSAVFGANKTIFPIPAGQLDANPALNGQQNPGY
ncbi:RagB/SusD family nutrient uptake outer membrane protein [Aquimarina pacifica]|uniref:RagB/SusD family nutrient uptake outer membrane protein n=1 Tax=Aquimarina pacifica TaxID=1296415 RepID=UPI0004714B29|nr:RagB/SusD family nutrient uptake outer membrane protein [Aquimarina pacifica]